MKTKDYVKKYNEAEDKNKIIVDIVNDFIEELRQLKESRNIKYDHALIPLLNDLDNKWKKFVQLTGDETISYRGFKNAVHYLVPSLKDFWK